MKPEDLPESKIPIGNSPRWIAIYAFVGLGFYFVTWALYGLPDSARSAARWVHAIVPVIALILLAREFAKRRRSMTTTEISYLRYAIVIWTGVGILGALPLTLVAGPAFYLWTVVEKRRITQ